MFLIREHKKAEREYASRKTLKPAAAQWTFFNYVEIYIIRIVAEAAELIRRRSSTLDKSTDKRR